MPRIQISLNSEHKKSPAENDEASRGGAHVWARTLSQNHREMDRSVRPETVLKKKPAGAGQPSECSGYTVIENVLPGSQPSDEGSKQKGGEL